MEPFSIEGLSVRPILGTGFGAEIEGVDWTRVPLSEKDIQNLVSLQNRFGVLIFRNTGLDNDRHVKFAAQLGELEKNPTWGGTQRVGTPYLFDVSNVESDGSIVRKGSRRWAHALGNALWHTDSSFNQHRSKYSLLLAHKIPGVGQANTEFADTRQAWEDLSDARKEELRDMIVEHDLWHSRRLASPDIYEEATEEERSKKPPAYHKLVQRGPDERETFFLAAHAKTLFDNNRNAIPNSQEIIWDLIHHCSQQKYVFTAEWTSPGDLTWWDNRQSMHRASPYDENMGVRDVRRATVFDDGDEAFGTPIKKKTIVF